MHEEKKKQMPPKQSEVDSYSFKPKINEFVTADQFKRAIKEAGFDVAG